MIDLVAAAVLVFFVVRGWRRGLVREALDVATLVVGVVIAFRLAGPVGRLAADQFGWSPEAARVVAGGLLFLALSVGAGFAAAAIHRSMRRLPGTSLLNNFAGAGLGAVYAGVLAVAAVTLLAALPLPAPMAAEVAGSEVAERVVDPNGLAQRAVQAASGDRAVQSMIWLRRLAGEWLFVPVDGGDLELPPTGDSEARPSTTAAAAVAGAVNRARHDGGLAALRWSEDLTVFAAARAGAIYRSGSFAESRSLDERLEAAGIAVGGGEERLLLAPTAEAVGTAIDSAGNYDRAGIGVVDGPYGMVAVLVLVDDA